MLAKYVREVMAQKELSYRDVARQSEGTIAQSTVGDILNDPKKDVGVLTCRALARGLDEPEETVINAARGIPPWPEATGSLKGRMELLRMKCELASAKDLDYISQTIEDLIRRLDWSARQAPPERKIRQIKQA